MQLTLYGHATKQMNLNKKLNPVKLPFHELIFLLQGKAHYKIDGEDVLLQDRDVAYIPMGHLRERIDSTETADYVTIHFLQDEPLSFPKKMERMARGCIPHLISGADSIYEDLQSDGLEMIEKIFVSVIEYMQLNLSRRQESPLVKKIKHYMLDHLYAPFQVKDLAHALFMSESYCHAVFKRETGIPLMTYFNSLRLQEAKKQIALGEQSLTDIVDSLCFYDYNYFSRMFKKHFDITPAQYRKQLYHLDPL